MRFWRGCGKVWLEIKIMCRLAEHTYKEPFACFDCRKVFKQISRWELPQHQRPAPGQPRTVLCPQCRRPLADMGRDFKAPRSAAVKQWAKVKILFEHGFNFYSCGCCGPGYRPAQLREVYDFITSQQPLSDGERLLKKFAARQAA